jgi:hypothetical protein
LSAASVNQNTPVTLTASYASRGVTKTASYIITVLGPTAGGGSQVTELITDGGFETGNSGVWHPNTVADGTPGSAGIVNLGAQHSGSWYAYVGDNGTAVHARGSLFQFITIPANLTSIVLTFYLNITTAETSVGPFDVMDVNLRTIGDSLIAKLRRF